MVDNLEIETPGPLPSGIRNIMPQLLNDANSLSRPRPAEAGLTVYFEKLSYSNPGILESLALLSNRPIQAHIRIKNPLDRFRNRLPGAFNQDRYPFFIQVVDHHGNRG